MEKEAVICAVLVFVTATAGVSQNSELSCPSTFFKEGSSIMNLTIVNSTFHVCDKAPTFVACRWSEKGGMQRVICKGNVIRCEKDPEFAFDCRCVEENEQGFKYSFNFSMLRGQEQGFITCEVDCPKATVDSSEQCLNIKFVSKCNKNGQCKHGTCHINENKDTICDCTGTGFVGRFCEILGHVVIALICVSILLVVVVAAVTAGVYCAMKQRSGDQQNAPPANDPPYTGPPDNSPQVNGTAGPSTG
ncbi:uncharacterized protein [Littorina saxatilis]|uniref:EGF-like domain-containing protein n=1 Tax=Littorina saxatilis TaxID=31220 RepID=A0AAN9GEQ8_9CAEN